jgi:hypothetical protein
MAIPRRDFIRGLLGAGALPGLIAVPGTAAVRDLAFDPEQALEINPDFDARAYEFWWKFLTTDGEPAIAREAPGRGTRAQGPGDAQPVFLHYGPDGFQNAAELSPGKMVEQGDVVVSVNTSTVKVGTSDQRTFERVQNAQLRVDLAQKRGIIPWVEAMAYTVVAAMRTVEAGMPQPRGSKRKAAPTVQNVTLSSDAAWQKMQHVPLPSGEGRWALNLEAQKKDSLFCSVLRDLIKQTGLFSPMIGLPGITMSALQSFNNLYGILHSKPVHIIQSNPVRVFATQEAVQKTGASGSSVTGIKLQSGTYILMPAGQMPPLDQLKKLTVKQGRVVPPEASLQELDEAAADAEQLKDVTYVTFDIEVTPATLLPSASPKQS